MQVRAFLAACDRAERDALTVEFALALTAQRGSPAEIKSFLRELTL